MMTAITTTIQITNDDDNNNNNKPSNNRKQSYCPQHNSRLQGSNFSYFYDHSTLNGTFFGEGILNKLCP